MKSKWLILYITSSCTSLVFLDTAIMPIALPTIQKHFHLQDFFLPWILNVYLLCLASFLLIGGKLTDIFGKRKLILSGLSIFGIGSLIGGTSFATWSLLLGRALQGLASALIVPPTGALLIEVFPQGERGRAIGVNTAVSSIFLIFGPALGGWLTQYVSWRGTFFLNLPVVLFGLLMSIILLNKEKIKKQNFHFSSACSLVFGLVFIVTGLMQGNTWGWTSPLTLFFIIAAPLCLLLFILQTKRTTHPIIDVQLFKNSHFSAAIFCIFAVQIVIMITVIWALYFQQQLHFSPTKTGLLIVISVLPIFLVAPIGGFFADKVGPRTPLLLGFAFLTFSLLWLLFNGTQMKILTLLPGLLSFGGAIPLILSPITALALSQSPPNHLGAASGLTVETRQLASTTGLALFSAIFHGIAQATGSFEKAFIAISFAASIFALLGFFTVLLWIKKTHPESIANKIGQ